MSFGAINLTKLRKALTVSNALSYFFVVFFFFHRYFVYKHDANLLQLKRSFLMFNSSKVISSEGKNYL